MDSDKQGLCQLVDSISTSGNHSRDEFSKGIIADNVREETQVMIVTPIADCDPLSDVNRAEFGGTVTKTTQNEEETCEEASDSRSKSAFKVDVNAIKSVSIEDQADEIKNLGLKVFDQHTLEKGIWDQVEHESQRLQTEEELAILDTTIKKKELLLKKSAIKLKSKPAAESKPEQKEISELADLQAKQSLLRERLTQGLKPKENEESEKERSIRLGEMTPFGTIVSAQSSGLPPSLSQYLKKQQELQMKMQERKQAKREMSSNNATMPERRKLVRGQSQSSVANLDTESSSSSSSPEKIQARKRKKTEKLGSKMAMFSGQSREQNPGEVETMDVDESGSEYVPSEDSFDEFNEEGDAESPEFEGDDEKKKTKPKQQRVQCDKPKKRKTSVGGSRPKRKRVEIAQDPEDWATDDSDWICTDDELSSGTEYPARKMKRLVKKEKDDGNEDDFYRRMKQWEKSNPGLREEMEGDCHELQNDFKVPRKMWDKLYKYQQVGVQWFWELHLQGCGGILGDEMGLGKTVQVIAFLAGLRLSRIKSTLLGYRSLGPVLIVCPTTVMHQWVREFHTWFPPLRVAVLHESGTFQGKRDHLVKNMVKARGVVITSYTAVVRLKDALLDAHWHYIVLDEGHKIRNPDAQVTMVVKQFRTPHRIILSGSPVQNHLRELWSLMDFVFPGKLGTLPVFMAQFGVPIVQGGYANASDVMVATAFKCATVLKDTVTPYLLRRMKTDVNGHISLPPKNEQVLFCRLTDQQRDLYKGYLDCGEVGRILDGRLQIFVGLINLRKICNHPHLYSGGPKLFAGESEDRIPVEDRYGHWSKAGKMIVMEALLKMWHRQEHRVLIFTQSKQMLGIMESFIIQEGYKYLKLDGGTSISARQPLINKFNQDKSYFVMILTTRVGGLGVNLTGADRVVIYDPDWNPATDTQARERAWRIGQQNCVTVYRLITAGTIEEKMYHRQIFKQFLCNKVLKDPRQRRFFKSNDLLELFTLKEVDTEGSTETSAIFAGTGSQVHVKKKKSTPKKEEAKSPPKRAEPSRRPSESSKAKASPSPKESKSIVSKENERSSSRKSTKQPVSVQFSESKLQHMKQLAAMLSKKLAKKADDATTTGEVGSASGDVDSTPIKKTGDASTTGEVGSASTDVDSTSTKTTNDATGEDIKTSAEAEAAAETSETHPRSSADGATPNTSLFSGNLGKETSQDARTSAALGAPKPDVADETREKENRCAVPVPSGEETLGNVPKLVNAEKTTEKSLKRSEEKQAKEPKKHKKHKKHRKERNAKFEGERVPHLVRSSAMKAEETVDEIAHNSKQDDYVLRKLFSKTGLQTAMQHEKIMEGGHADYALIEGEAKKVAQEAVKALKESRRQCWSAASGVPTWTGTSGAIRRDAQPSNSRPKFGPKKKFGAAKTSTVTSDDSKEESGSGDLLARIRARNMLLNETDETQPADTSIVSRSNADLLDDIRAFVSFGAQTNGQASTEEIVSHFKDRLPPESSALFKQMLNQVCEFHRSSSGVGFWKLLPDFNW